MAYGLDTDSSMRCFRQTSSRKGYPLTIVSNRGTNFIGAERELRELVDEFDHFQIQDQTTSKEIKWSFNHPLAPHFRRVYRSCLKQRKRLYVHCSAMLTLKRKILDLITALLKFNCFLATTVAIQCPFQSSRP